MTAMPDLMRKSALNLMRKNHIKDFSDEELHRVFKHARERATYLSLVKNAISNGLTVESLYQDQDHEHGFDR